MKKSRFSDSQIIAILNQSEAGAAVPELCREHPGVAPVKRPDDCTLSGW